MRATVRFRRYLTAMAVVVASSIVVPGAASAAPGGAAANAPGQQLTPPGQIQKLNAAGGGQGQASLHNPNLSQANSPRANTAQAHQDPADCDGDSGGHSDTGHGANQGGPYDNTCPAGPSQNGQGGGQATGRPCAGCVGQADDKNPRGQEPGPNDNNNGYECDGNKGIARGNPAHTGCTSSAGGPPPPPPPPPPSATAAATSCDTDGVAGPNAGSILVTVANIAAADVIVTIAGSPAVVGSNARQAGSYLVVVKKASDGSTVLSQVVTVADCTPSNPFTPRSPLNPPAPITVLGTQFSRTPVTVAGSAIEVLGLRLSRTGMETVPALLGALVLLMIGFVLERAARSGSVKASSKEWNWSLA